MRLIAALLLFGLLLLVPVGWNASGGGWAPVALRNLVDVPALLHVLPSALAVSATVHPWRDFASGAAIALGFSPGVGREEAILGARGRRRGIPGFCGKRAAEGFGIVLRHFNQNTQNDSEDAYGGNDEGSEADYDAALHRFHVATQTGLHRLHVAAQQLNFVEQASFDLLKVQFGGIPRILDVALGGQIVFDQTPQPFGMCFGLLGRNARLLEVFGVSQGVERGHGRLYGNKVV